MTIYICDCCNEEIQDPLVSSCPNCGDETTDFSAIDVTEKE